MGSQREKAIYRGMLLAEKEKTLMKIACAKRVTENLQRQIFPELYVLQSCWDIKNKGGVAGNEAEQIDHKRSCLLHKED